MVIASSPAKIILFGEHFVVAGNSAISMTIDLPTTVTAEIMDGKHVQIESTELKLRGLFNPNGGLEEFNGDAAEATLRPIYEAVSFTMRHLRRPQSGLRVIVESDVPIGMGLGSSAATAVATVSAVSRLLDHPLSKEEVFEAAYSLERMVHGRPSGIDQATVTYGGLISYRNGTIEAQLTPPRHPNLIIGNTGKRRSTGDFVGKVTRLRRDEPEKYSKIATQAQNIAERARNALSIGQLDELGSLMDDNQKLLEMIGVSSPDLERLISAARSAGAQGAKLTGGGGGGCMIAMADHTAAEVCRSIEATGGRVLPSTFTPFGVQVIQAKR